MSRAQFGIVLILALTCIGVLADAALKLASHERDAIQSKWLFIGLGLSCAFAVGWMFIMRLMKIATAGVIYGVGSALCFVSSACCSSMSICPTGARRHRGGDAGDGSCPARKRRQLPARLSPMRDSPASCTRDF